jgi:hypothetical protein
VNIHAVLEVRNTLFKENFLSFNFEKTHYIHFKTRNSPSTDLKIGSDNNLISNALHTKFLGLTIDGMFSWRTHTDQLVIKLSTACYVIRSLKPCMSHKTLLQIYYSLFHSVMSYGIIVWGNSYHSIKIFRMQRRVIRIIMGHRSKDSCRNAFTALEILPLISQYIFSSLVFAVSKRHQFLINS